MRSVYFEYAGVLSLLFIAIFLLAFIFPRVNDWSEDWRSYAHTSEYAGACSAPSPPPQCDEDPPFEVWMTVPWLLAVGSMLSLLAVIWPTYKELRR